MFMALSWFAFTAKGLTTILKKNVIAHKCWMIRSYAMATTAITFRLYYIILYVFNVPLMKNYEISLWMSVLGNLLISEAIIFWRNKKYLKSFSNIRYVRINENLSHSALLNLGIKYAFAPLITHTYIHDRRTIFSLEEQVSILEKNPEIDLVYADYCITNTLNAPWFDDIHNFTQITVADPVKCPLLGVGAQPVWRKSIYFTHGFFKEDGCGCTTDQMWGQLINAGSIIVKAPHISGLCYIKK